MVDQKTYEVKFTGEFTAYYIKAENEEDAITQAEDWLERNVCSSLFEVSSVEEMENSDG